MPKYKLKITFQKSSFVARFVRQTVKDQHLAWRSERDTHESLPQRQVKTLKGNFNL